MDIDTEVKAPSILLAIGAVVNIIAVALTDGVDAVPFAMVGLVVGTVVSVALGIVALLIAAPLTGASYGHVPTAMLKLAAVLIFPSVVYILLPIPVLSWIVAVLIYLGIVAWLFDLEGWELLVTVFIIWLVRVLVLLGLVAFA